MSDPRQTPSVTTQTTTHADNRHSTSGQARKRQRRITSGAVLMLEEDAA
ncbi:hypothetical protein ACIA5H_21655 [Nocardia sp. NPDC051900]